MSNSRIQTLFFAALLAMSAVVAAHASANSQQERMSQCNVEAKAHSLAGSARKQFVKDCLSTHPAAKRALNRQQLKMKSCNVDAKAKGLKGAERRNFMSTCLKR